MPERGDIAGISTSNKIKEELRSYKEDNETWDDFFIKVLKLIEQDTLND